MFFKKRRKKKIRARVCPPQCVVIDPWRESTLFKFSPPISPTWGRQKQPGFLRFRKLRGNEARGWRLLIVSNAAEQRMVRRSACGFKPCMKLYPYIVQNTDGTQLTWKDEHKKKKGTNKVAPTAPPISHLITEYTSTS